MTTESTMDIKTKISHAELNLQRKLDWMSRYDTRIIFVAGIAVAMLGVLASASGNVKCWFVSTYFFFGLALILLSLSLLFVYFSQKPIILAPNQSLLYFKTISKMGSTEFIQKFKNTTEEEYLEDLLYQTHINSQILSKKFQNLKYSLTFIAVSIIPWGISIYLSKLYFN